MDMDFDAVIFDMDGLLIDSEPLWRQAERAAFAEVGVILSDEDCELTMGFRTDEVIAYWYKRIGWSGASVEDVASGLIDRVRVLIIERGQALPGVYDTLELLEVRGMKMALASSSAMVLIEAVIDKLGIRGYFEVVCSAMDEVRGKPDPAVFLTAARRLGKKPGRCLVFEDSIAGVEAALAAQMSVVAVPAGNLAHHEAFARADLKLSSLQEFNCS
jgi:HAD superfamily hydrolase (TIGR01509 family)